MSKRFPAARKFLALIAVVILGAAMLTAKNVGAEEEEHHGGIGIGISLDVMQLLKKKKKQVAAPGPAPAKKKTVAKPKDATVAAQKPIGGMPPKGENRYRRDEVLFVLKPASPAETLANVVQAQNLRRIDEAPLQLLRRTVHRYAITDGRTVSQVITALEANPNIESAQPEYRYELTDSASSAVGGQLQYANVKLRVDEAHKWVTGKDVVVALIDSRIDISHEALEHSIKDSYSAVDHPSSEADTHGTAMAGAIAGHGRILGTAPQSKLLAVECFSMDKEGHMEGITFNILKGVDWAHAHAAFIINMSFAGPRDPLLSRLMNAAAKNGVILIAAAGNAGAKSPPLYPGADENAVAVSATDSRDRLFKLANRGKYIAVAAPGVDVIALAPGNATVLTSGTSVAAAHISGLAALAMERAIKIDMLAFRKILQESASKLQAPANSVGAGRADALRLVEKAAELDPNQTAQQ
jgi:subtilisin family serine protease